MKYPNLIFFRSEKYNEIDKFIENNKDKFDCNFNITSNYDDVKKLFNSDYHLLVTYGPEESEYVSEISKRIVGRMYQRWLHYTKIDETNLRGFVEGVNYCYIHNCVQRKRNRPIFSLFTTCYNSFDKIRRVYTSLQKQILRDWEWVVLDDSPDEKNFGFLKELFNNDPQIRLYKRDKNSGSIGNVKNEAISLCRGEYVLELDHDDELLPYTLSEAEKVFKEDPEVGFIYMDFINIYEDGRNFWFGDWISKGYGGYYSIKYNGKWAYVYITPNINNVTLSALVSLPNHPRIWRKDVLMKMESYSEYLPICDDLEILLRTGISTKCAKIPVMGYVQYMNDNSNGGNFTWIRNHEINRLGPQFIYPIFYQEYNVNQKFKEMGAYEDEKYIHHDFTKIWKRKDYKNVYANKLVAPYKRQYCLIGAEQLDNPEFIKAYQERTKDDDFILISNRHVYEDLWFAADCRGMGDIKISYLKGDTLEECIKFFDMLYRSSPVENCIYFMNKGLVNIEKNPKLFKTFDARSAIVNKYLKKDDENENSQEYYLEIGVETGASFREVKCDNKTGVDPDPVWDDPCLIRKTSDDFFKDSLQKFNHIFIDGMHHSDFVMRDFINSVNALFDEGGMIYIDDVLPISMSEQFRIPAQHYYNNGILKYKCPWTGDVWKAIYFILENYSDKFEISIYSHINYRGVAALKIKEKFDMSNITEEDIENIQHKYDYFSDFPSYLEKLNSLIV